jgi:Flp pilus assembly protein TadG
LRACLRSGSEGQSLVEFAFVLPVLALLLTGIFWCGINMGNYLALSNAVDVGSRYLVIEGNTTGTSTGNLADPCQAVFTQMMGSATSSSSSTLDPDQISVTYTLNGSPIGPFKGRAQNTCAGQSDNFANGGVFTMVATYPCSNGIYGVNLSSCKFTVSSPPNQTITTN